ncbi:coproporphyrinogen III oxidase [Ilyobacter polytropus]|uniref:Coproporphyrinogen dehydrogenase n=1 Tax=Ilyobacter polytropus (strain ATCC 51220 / DSM 2926 / LMG 16218 / CuHBu1) TaxID=572544 RepID=E3HAG5_ILYPC|nr:coproporphyrinogen III oxidase [Ilyobacter polytropus]ADO82039.1 Coproporphyrinogen dehydrogenase [Ilyobacter polytropus DSM 2926]
MILDTDFDITENSMDEFLRILVPEARGRDIKIRTIEEGENISLLIETNGFKKQFTYKNHIDRIDDQKIVMAKTSLLEIYGKDYAWGSLKGVRPTKLVRRLLALNYDYLEIKDILEGLFKVSEKKSSLIIEVVKKEMEYLNREYINMYIGIPFCPTKCRYCSFASYEINSGVGRHYNAFVDTLIEEIKLTGEHLKENGYKLGSVYIGGGTPSILTETDIERVLASVKNNVDLSSVKEFTFEAGRVDTLTKKKLEIMKNYGVDRISLNPQTFNEETLKNLNRTFSRDKFDEMYSLSKNMGFIINMDLIIGLPGEGTKEILNTMKELEKYQMENLTVHVLALKKASVLFKEGHQEEKIDRQAVENGIEELTKKKSLKPYYMYRLKNSTQWGENLGYAIEGKESIFNIEMIEENQSTIGLGGGAITKKISAESPVRDHIDRLVGPKEPATYVREMRERLKKKLDLFKK